MNVTIPDFDVMSALADKIGELTRKKNTLDVQIKFEEAKIVKACTTDKQYFQGEGDKMKPPAMNFIEATYSYTGFNNELIPMRLELANTVAELEKSKLTWEIFKQEFEMYRTESANNRKLGELL